MTKMEFIWKILIPAIIIGLTFGFVMMCVLAKLFSQNKKQNVLADLKEILFGNI